MSDSVTVGIVGTGVGIRTHLAGMEMTSGAEVVGVVGSSLGNAERHLAAAGARTDLACDLDDLLGREPQLICLATPPLARERYLPPLAASGAALLVEKPVAVSHRAAVAELAAVEPGAAAFTNLQLRGLPAFRELRERIAEGALGVVYSLRAEEKTAAFRGSAVAEWQRYQGTGGGQRLAMGPHLLDLTLFLLGAGYDEVRGDAPSAEGSMATPLGRWASDLERSETSPISDETFRATFAAKGCWIDMFTTSIAVGPRTLKVELDGTEGVLRFAFVDGVGQVELISGSSSERYSVAADGSLIAPNAERLNPSIFRIAYPSYAEAIINRVRTGRPDPLLASLDDGLANLGVLDQLVANDA